jgi:1-acyl-sn-glycerol-3-phosphate acyltransferase
MTISKIILRRGLQVLSKLLFRVHGEELSKVPDQGPLIIVSNHINMAEVGIIYALLMPRPVTGFIAEYRMEAAWSRWIANTSDAIPLHRGKADVTALKEALERLKDGQILAVAPEGTRSGHGRLQKAHPGAMLLALRTGAPLLPLVFYGHENWLENLKRFRRTDFYIRVGVPFNLDPGGARVDRAIRQRMIDEVMYQIAALLPEKNRGAYADLDAATTDFLEFNQKVQGV